MAPPSSASVSSGAVFRTNNSVANSINKLKWGQNVRSARFNISTSGRDLIPAHKKSMDIELGERVVRVDDGASFCRSLTRVQAIVRGARVRRLLLETRHQYEMLLSELEERSLLQLSWPRSLPCAPSLTYPSYSKASQSPRPSSCMDDAAQPQRTACDKPIDDSPRGSCSCCTMCQHVVPHEIGESGVISGLAVTKGKGGEESSEVCHSEKNVSSADVDDSQEKPTSDSCKVDSGSIETPSAPTMHQRDVSKPQLGVATVDGEKPLRDGSSFQDKNINGEQRGKPGQESFPEGRGGGYAKLDSVTRGTADVSSVWDSFDVSAIRESQESLPVEESLEERKRNLTMDLLWIQQAIESRKQYLRLKTEMTQTAS